MFRPFEAKPQVGEAVTDALPARPRGILSSRVLDLGSLDTGAPLEVRPLRFGAPPLPSDLLPPFQKVISGPVGLQTGDAFLILVVTHGYLISPTPVFPGVLRKYTLDPGKVSAQVKLEEKFSSLLLRRAIVKVDDPSDLYFLP